MNILIIRTNAVNPDPRVEKEANSLLKSGVHSVTILAWDRDNNSDSDSCLNLPNGSARIIRFGIISSWGGGIKKNLIPLLKFSLKVRKWLKKHHSEFDCFHCCDLPTAMMCGRFLKKKKFVYDIFDYFADTAHAPKIVLNYARKKEKKMIELADYTIICSEQRIKQLGDARPKRLVVIHNSPDESILNFESPLPMIKSSSSLTRLVYVGNLIEERFIKEAISVVENHPDLELHIGGAGTLTQYVEKASQENRNIYYYGKLSYDKVLSLEKECDVMIALYDPSIRNNTFAAPNKFYESLLVGRPIVMIENTGVDQLINEWQIGAVSRTIDDANLYEAIIKAKKLLKNDPDYEKRARLLYKNMFSWSKMEERLLKIYEAI